MQALRGLGKVVIAYSGGVDSSFLLKAAVETLGAENVLACIDAGASLPQSQYKAAVKLAEQMGSLLQTIKSGEINDSAYSANKADRCFHCKYHLFQTLLEIAKANGFDHVLCGNNFDDLDDYRPGNRAAGIFNIKSPLADAQLTKSDIRELSRDFDLPTADIPASPCLASRIVYGLEVTAERLSQVEQAEEFLKQLGFIEFRVRHHDQVARIEVQAEDIEKIIAEPVRTQIVEKLKSLGFKFITVDMKGFRSGSLNELLSEKDKRKSLK